MRGSWFYIDPGQNHNIWRVTDREQLEGSRQTRKMQLSGGSTYVVSLPRAWMDEMGIAVGDSVTIVRNANQSLSLFPERAEKGQRKAATVETGQRDAPESVKRKLVAAYLGGYSTIKIRSRGMRIPPGHSRGIRGLVRSSMIGTEIVESSSESMTIQILSSLPELSFETALRRMYLMAQTMVQEAVESLDEMDAAHAEEVVNMDDEVDRFGLYMRRNLGLAVENGNVLQDMGLHRPSDCLGYRAVISRIERIADHAVLVAKRTRFAEERIEKRTMAKIRRLSESALAAFGEAVAAVQDRDFEGAEAAAQKVPGIIEEEKQIMAGLAEGRNSTIIRFVLEDVRRIAEYSGDIAEVAIDGNIQGVISEEQGRPTLR